MKYSLGLDIGISSIGWAVVNLEKNRIEDLGVRLFTSAERPKDGGAINEKRRLARGLRRRLKRRRVRMNKIKELFVKYEIISKDETERLYVLSNEDIDTWQLRAEGLDRKLTPREWARVLTSIAKRRGYKSNRKTEANSDEGGKIIKSIALNKAYMESNGYRTVGEMFAKDEKYIDAKRNKNGQYNNCIDRSELEDETKILFSKQRELGNTYTSADFENEYLQVFNYQKPFMTPELMDKMVGKCTLEKDEPRAAKNSWTFERAMLLQKVNNLAYQVDSKKIFLSEEQREKVIDLAYKLKSGVKYKKIRSELDIPEEAVFVGLNYYIKPTKNKKTGEYEKLSAEEIRNKVEDASTFVKLNGYHEIKTAFEKADALNIFDELCKNEHEKIDRIAEVLTRNKTDVEIIKALSELGIDDKVIDELTNVTFAKFGHLSYKALNKILPFLEEGKQYDKACQSAEYNFKNDDGELKYKLPVISKDEIRNPVVYRSVTQTRKVINAIIDKYGSPFEIHIELARELTKNFKERKDIESKQKENRTQNEILKNDIKQHFGITAKPVDMLKVRLYREQNGKSAYSMQPIEYARLFENGYVEIDHAIPFSRSFDDSYNNKVLVLSRENQEKKNKTPYEYFGSTSNWDEFEAFVKTTYRNNMKKRENLLVKNFNADKERDWLERNLNDTKYIARFLLNYIKKNLAFENFGEPENRIKVKAIVGSCTTALRHYWGIPTKDREKNDLHHAEDAVIIACATEKFQKRIREYSRQKELYYQNKNGEYFDEETGEIVDVKYKTHEMERPWPEFKEELEARMSENPSHDLASDMFKNYDDVDVTKIKPIFVSRMPNRKVTGQAHEETIYSSKLKDKGIVMRKEFLNQITKSEIEMILTNENYRDIYQSDKELYDSIYARMEECNFKADKAFNSEYVLRKRAKNGDGPVVKSIKVPSSMNSGLELQKGSGKGIAANGGMVRVDVFTKNGKYYLVPLYVADMIKEVLPNKAIKSKKSQDEWIEMDETYEFIFSLYYNDLVGVKKKGEKIKIMYFLGVDINRGTLTLINHDKSLIDDKETARPGVQNLEVFEKYEVDILGNYHKVKNEKRKGGIKSKK